MNNNLEIAINVVGYIGSALLIIAFALNSLKVLKSFSIKYQILNLLGGSFVLWNSWYYHAFPSVVVSIFWVIIALVAMVRIKRSPN